jgi:CPA1 family monovalent cation:H+ antiporter
MEHLELIILLLFGISFLAVLSRRYNFPFPILLVFVGLIVSFIPGVPLITLKPEIVFLIFLPPLLYGAAWNTSWHDFKANIRPITLAGVGLVFFTTLLVAAAAHYFIPQMSWTQAFLLGAIVSPPDAVAATSITKGLGLNPRIISIIEGESLVNDASGLIAYKYALAAIVTGSFSLQAAGLQFLLVVSGGIAIGFVIGYLMYLVHTKFICEAVVEVALTLFTPYASYLLAEYFHMSGVLAVVTTGLYLSHRSDVVFTPQSRIQAYAVWDVVVFILNGLIFILLGLQLKNVLAGISESSPRELIFYGLMVSVVVVLVRFVWVIPAALLPRMLSKRIREKEVFDKRNLLVFGWAGIRGVVSMAAVLAIPILTKEGTAFPNRNLLIFLTFCVIIFTLIVQGLSLPWLIRKLKIPKHSIAAEEYTVRTEIVTNIIQHIEENLSLVSEDLLNNVKSKYETRYKRLQYTEVPLPKLAGANAPAQNAALTIFNEFTNVQLDLIKVERDMIRTMHQSGKVNEEILRKIERELDMEESRLRLEVYSG